MSISEIISGLALLVSVVALVMEFRTLIRSGILM